MCLQTNTVLMTRIQGMRNLLLVKFPLLIIQKCFE